MANDRKYWARIGGAVMASQVALAGAAFAQAPADSPEAATQSEIIVTATRRSQSLMEVPASISALSGDQLALRGVTDIESLSGQVPNVLFGQYHGSTFITIRGVGTTVEAGIAEPPAATYVDGIFLPRQSMGTLQQGDLERVEVLRGPQGTLYGRNATAGAINFISRDPTPDFEGGVTASYSSYDTFNAYGYLSGGLAPGAMARVSLGTHISDGYTKNLATDEYVGGAETIYGRAALLLEPASNVSVRLFALYETDDSDGAFVQALTPITSPLFPPTTNQTTEPHRLYADGPTMRDKETLVLGGIVDWRLSDTISLRSTTGYIDHTATTGVDGDGTDYPFLVSSPFTRKSEMMSQEFALHGETGRLDWVLGAFLYREEFSAELHGVWIQGLSPVFVPGADSYRLLGDDTDSYAIFADLTFSLTDNFRLLGGLRYNWEEKNFTQTVGQISPSGVFAGINEVPTRLSSSDLLPKIGFQWDFADNFNLYGTYQEGIKSGGQQISAVQNAYEAEAVSAYEIGLKGSFAEGRVNLSVAAFSYDFANLQVAAIPSPGVNLILNADAELQGVEAELQLQPTDNFRVGVAATWLNAEYTDFMSADPAFPGLGVQDLRGQQLNRAPDFAFRANAEYEIPLNTRLLSGILLAADMQYNDNMVLRYNGAPNDQQEAYTVYNASVSLISSDENSRLRFFGRNLGDEEYKQAVNYVGAFGAYYGSYGPPRLWGVEFSTRF